MELRIRRRKPASSLTVLPALFLADLDIIEAQIPMPEDHWSLFRALLEDTKITATIRLRSDLYGLGYDARWLNFMGEAMADDEEEDRSWRPRSGFIKPEDLTRNVAWKRPFADKVCVREDGQMTWAITKQYFIFRLRFSEYPSPIKLTFGATELRGHIKNISTLADAFSDILSEVRQQKVDKEVASWLTRFLVQDLLWLGMPVQMSTFSLRRLLCAGSIEKIITVEEFQKAKYQAGHFKVWVNGLPIGYLQWVTPFTIINLLQQSDRWLRILLPLVPPRQVHVETFQLQVQYQNHPEVLHVPVRCCIYPYRKYDECYHELCTARLLNIPYQASLGYQITYAPGYAYQLNQHLLRWMNTLFAQKGEPIRK